MTVTKPESAITVIQPSKEIATCSPQGSTDLVETETAAPTLSTNAPPHQHHSQHKGDVPQCQRQGGATHLPSRLPQYPRRDHQKCERSTRERSHQR